jgi:protein subunit release factor B
MVPLRKKIVLPESDEALAAECQMQAFRASGSGGQHVNVTDSAVRLIHLPTGLTVTSQKARSQLLNKRECLLKLRELVEKLNYRRPRRVATRIPHAVKRRNLEKKAKHSQKKQRRNQTTDFS